MKKLRFFCLSLILVCAPMVQAQTAIMGTNHRKVFSGGGGATWALLHEVYCSNNSCPGGTPLTLGVTTATLTIPSTTAGAKGILSFASSDQSPEVTITSITGCETMTLPGATAQAVQVGSGSVDAAYVTSETGGKTTCTVNFSLSINTFAVLIWREFSSTNTASFDGCSALAVGSSSTTNATPSAPLVYGGANDVIVQLNIPANSITAISGSYVISSAGLSPDGMGSAYILNQASYPTANWTQAPAGVATENACALKQ